MISWKIEAGYLPLDVTNIIASFLEYNDKDFFWTYLDKRELNYGNQSYTKKGIR